MSEIHKIEVTMMYKAFISYKFFFQSICFDNLFPPNLLRMTQYDQFCLTFQSFPIKVAQNHLEWPILLNSQIFQSFPTETAQNYS